MPRKVYDTQVAFNMVSRYGEKSQPTLESSERRIADHLRRTTYDKATVPSMVLVQAPIFHAHVFSLYVEYDNRVSLGDLTHALTGEHVVIARSPDESPSNVSAAGQDDISAVTAPRQPARERILVVGGRGQLAFVRNRGGGLRRGAGAHAIEGTDPVKQIVRWLALVFVLSTAGCGYHTAGKASALPTDLRTVSIPAFKNQTQTYRIEQVLTAAVVREFTSRTHYHVLNSDSADADATLRGTVVLTQLTPLTYDSQTGRASSGMVSVNMKVTLTDRHGKVLFENPNYQFREQYQISREVSSFFKKSPRPSTACRRISLAHW